MPLHPHQPHWAALHRGEAVSVPEGRGLLSRAGAVAGTAGSGAARPAPAPATPADAPPAVLVDLHADCRLSLAALARDTGGALAGAFDIVRNEPGHLDLAPAAGGEAGITVTVDGRGRLALTPALAHRLGVPAGGRVLVTAVAEGGLRIVNLAVVVEALEVHLDGTGPGGTQPPGDHTTGAAEDGSDERNRHDQQQPQYPERHRRARGPRRSARRRRH